MIKWRVAALAFAIAIWIQSSIVYRLPEGSPGFTDKIAHTVAWAILAALIALGAPARRMLIIAIPIAIAYGVIDELHQSQVPGRDASIADVLADAAGAVLGSAAAVYARRHGDRS